MSLLRFIPTICAMAAAAPAGAGAPAPDDDVPSANTQRLEIDFQLAAGSGRVTGADVWYTLDDGRSWKPGQVEFRADAPLLFTTPDEGLHGLFVIVRNGVSASAPPPVSGTKPQLRVFVDATPPVVQVASVAVDGEGRSRRLVIRYVAYDSHLLARPISVECQRDGEMAWQPIAAALPNSGVHEWTIPPEDHGRMRVRVGAEDRGGQSAWAESDWIDLDTAAKATDTNAAPPAATQAVRMETPDPMEPTPARLAVLHEPLDDALAATLREARLRQSRGEWKQAELRFREALDREPNRTETQAALAGVLYHQGRLAEAEQAYRRLLRTEPKHAGGMAGLAMVLAARRDYPAARDVLTTLSSLRPGDPGVWIDLGDMQMLAGDRAAGRAAWLRARAMADLKPATREQLDRRLVIYPEQDVP